MKVSNQKPQSQQDITTLKNKKSSGLEKLDSPVGDSKSKVVSSEGMKLDAAKVALSERAQDMKKIKDIAGKAPDVNAEKVKKLRDLIESGNYKTDAKKIADKMVDEELKMATMGEE